MGPCREQPTDAGRGSPAEEKNSLSQSEILLVLKSGSFSMKLDDRGIVSDVDRYGC